jgi:hypothetical protein
MHVYLAGIYSYNFERGGRVYRELTPAEQKARDGIEHILESFWYLRKGNGLEKLRRDGARIFVDSGAFSAAAQNVQIDLDEYCRFIAQNPDIIATVNGMPMVSVLDVIGDPVATFNNQRRMEAQGVKPLPCFHMGEPEGFLADYVGEYPYVALGGMAADDVSTEKLIEWLDPIFERHLLDGSGNLRCRVHAFGMTSLDLMSRYPWTSVDSTSWVKWAGFGDILMPEYGRVTVSEISKRVEKEGQHLDRFPLIQREARIREIEAQGFHVERLRSVDGYGSRWAWNAWAFAQEGEGTG